jgi:hypothetical protein
MHICPDEFIALLTLVEHAPFIGSWLATNLRRLKP